MLVCPFRAFAAYPAGFEVVADKLAEKKRAAFALAQQSAHQVVFLLRIADSEELRGELAHGCFAQRTKRELIGTARARQRAPHGAQRMAWGHVFFTIRRE